jgi:protein-arginine kinase activator protein McsA
MNLGKAKKCCQNPANLHRVQVQNDIWVSMCRECGCKHWEAAAEPGKMGVKFL